MLIILFYALHGSSCQLTFPSVDIALFPDPDFIFFPSSLPIFCRCSRRSRLMPLSVPKLLHQTGRSPYISDWGTIWSLFPARVVPFALSHQKIDYENPSTPPVIMSTHFGLYLSRWDQYVKHPSKKWRRFASSTKVGAPPGLEAEDIPLQSRTYVDTAKTTIIVQISRLGGYLRPLSVFQVFRKVSVLIVCESILS